ncbi:RTC4-like domain-containing protein [Terfezia claveryi]|nr:RTC4-like domain-containing protein [Terfezia claveryi]
MGPHTKPSVRTGLSKNTKVQPLLKSIPTTAKSKTSTPVPEVDMSPDQLAMDHPPGVANGLRRGVGLGNGLRSETNLAKRAARRSPTPTSNSTSSTTVVGRQGSIGLGAKKMRDKNQKKKDEEGEGEEEEVVVVEEGKAEKGKLRKVAVQVTVQRRSGRNVAAASLKPVVEEKAKVVKKCTKGKVDEKGYFHVASDTDGETAEKAGKKSSRAPDEWQKELLRDLASDMESLDSDGSDLGFKVASIADKPVRKSTITTTTMSKVLAKGKAVPAKDTAGLGRSTRSSRSAAAAAAAAATAVENGKTAEKDGQTEPVSVLGKWRERKTNEKYKIQEKEISSERSTRGESTSSKGSQNGSDKADPQVVDDMDCEKEDELYWAMPMPLKSTQRKPVQVYKSAKEKKKDIYKFLNGRSKPETKPPPRTKAKMAVEESVFQEPKFIEPVSYVNLSTPAPQSKKPNKDADLLLKDEFKNPFNEYGTSPDHLENPRFADETIKATGLVAQVDLTTPFKKRKTKSVKYLSDSDGSTLSTVASSPVPHVLDDGLDEPSTLSIISDPNICPICNDCFPDSFLLLEPEVSSHNMRIQLDRCRRHKRHAAEEICKDREYPATDIDWRHLPRRIDAHIPHLTEILEQKRSSTYRDAAGQDLATLGKGKGKRKLMDTDWQSHTPGYYGPRGAHVMLTAIMKKMANRIREVGSTDRLIAGGGVSAFVQSVLVPELGVRLVMDDLKCGEAKARKVVKETVEFGELINDEDEGGGCGDYFDDEEEEGGKWVTL